jgi:two-component system sensor histidine kinase KdpD
MCWNDTFSRWFFRDRVGYVASAVTFGVLTGVLAPLLGTAHLLDVALVYLLVALVGSAIWGYRVGLANAVAANVLVNLFFVPPLDRLSVQEPENVVALVLFLTVAAIGAVMFALLRQQLLVAEARRWETATLLGLSQALAHAPNPRNALQQFCTTAARGLRAQGCAILRAGPPWSVAATTGNLELAREDEAMAAEALRSGSIVRSGGAAAASRTTVGSALTFVPLPGREQGCLRLIGHLELPPLVEEQHLLEVLASEATLSLQRARLAEEASHVEALNRADEMKTALLSSISHDLRTPLTAIKASVESLRDGKLQWSAQDTASFLETIESETDRLTETVSNLLEMSRLEGGATSVHIERVGVAALIGDAVAASRTVVGQRKMDICVEEGLEIRADYTLVLRAVINLIENAAKYSTSGMPISIRADGAGRVVRIEVGDSGPGIPAAELPHIFERLYRGSQAGRVRGNGLGLAIVHAMVRLSGGRVDVVSDRSGTTFTLEFPAVTVPV